MCETFLRVAAQRASASSCRRASAPSTRRSGCGSSGNRPIGGSGANTDVARQAPVEQPVGERGAVLTARRDGTCPITSLTPVTTTATSAAAGGARATNRAPAAWSARSVPEHPSTGRAADTERGCKWPANAWR